MMVVPEEWTRCITPSLVRAATHAQSLTADDAAAPLALATHLYGITSFLNLAHFFAQVGHETSSLRYRQELWGPTTQQKRYERDFAQEWSKDNKRNSLAFELGNSNPGDGSLFRGHGWIHTTGRGNHRAVTLRLRQRFAGVMYVPDFELHPEMLTSIWWAALSAADYWEWKKIGPLAEADKIEVVTRRVNGGLNGLADRTARLAAAKKALLSSGWAP